MSDSDQGAQNAHNPQNPEGASPRGNRKPPPEHTRWKPGQSGNPGGRPKGESLTARLRRVLEGSHQGRELLDLLAERVAKEALSGKFPFVKEVFDRLDGPLNQKHDVKQCNDVRIIVADARGNEREGGPDDIRKAMISDGLAPGERVVGLRELYANYPALPPGAAGQTQGGTDGR